MAQEQLFNDMEKNVENENEDIKKATLKNLRNQEL